MNMLLELLDKLSRFVYDWSWILDPTEDDYKYFDNVSVDAAVSIFPGYGMNWMFCIFVVCALIATCYFFFVQARNANLITKGTFLFTFLIGILVMLVLDFVIMVKVVELPDPFSSGNMWGAVLASLGLYVILFEVLCLCFRKMSNAPTYDLWNVIVK